MTPYQVAALFDSLESGYAPILGNPDYTKIWYLEENVVGILVKKPKL